MIYYVTDWGDFILCLETTNAYALHQMFLFPFADYNRIICQRRNEYEAAYLESISDPSAEIVHTTVRSWICFQGLMTGAELRFYHWEEMRAQLESSDDWRQHTPKTSDLYTWGGKKTEPVETPVWAINAAASNDEGETTEPPLGTSAKNPVSPWIWGISLTVLFTAAVAVSFFLGTKRGKQSVKQT